MQPLRSRASYSDLTIKAVECTRPAYKVQYPNGTFEIAGEDVPQCTFLVPSKNYWRSLHRKGTYAAGLAFIDGEIDVEGNFAAAVRICMDWPTARLHASLFRVLAGIGRSTVAQLLRSRFTTAQQIRFHYDRSNAFYAQFLDSRMVYSCAYFRDAAYSLEAAQEAKLEHICRKLDLHPGESFLDVGCGWGALILHAAGRYGVSAAGCTLSPQQAEFAQAAIARQSLESRVEVYDSDYRDIEGSYDKIASVGMFEHVGPRGQSGYFRKIHSLLQENGLFLNHGIVRPQTADNSGETLFVQRYVFPGGGLVTLADEIRAAELTGFEVIDCENLRPHYARTCTEWANRLQAHASQCRQYVDEKTYRTWLLYLTASALNFEAGDLEIHQVLFQKRSAPAARHATREYMYR